MGYQLRAYARHVMAGLSGCLPSRECFSPEWTFAGHSSSIGFRVGLDLDLGTPTRTGNADRRKPRPSLCSSRLLSYSSSCSRTGERYPLAGRGWLRVSTLLSIRLRRRLEKRQGRHSRPRSVSDRSLRRLQDKRPLRTKTKLSRPS